MATLTKQLMEKSILIAHAAGLIDAEGCVTIAYKRKMNSYSPNISVGMGNRKPIKRLLGLLSGNMGEHITKSGRLSFKYDASNRLAEHALRLVRPYLIEKRLQCDRVLDLAEDIKRTNARPGWRNGLPENVHARRRKLMEEVKSLKRTPTVNIPSGRRLSQRENLAYLAGVMEGDGYLTILRTRKTTYYPSIRVSMASPAVIGEFFRVFGGEVFDIKRKNRKVLNTWQVTGPTANAIAQKLRPYFVFRTEEAELIRLLQNSIDLWRKRDTRALPNAVVAQRAKWHARIKALHKPARAETKPEQPRNEVSDSPICNEPKVAGPPAAA